MLSLIRANLFQILKLNRIFTQHNKNKNILNFYSDFKESTLGYILNGDIHFIMKDSLILGIIIIDSCNKLIHFMPIDNSISIFKLLHLLNRNLNVKGYALSLNYKKINTENLKKFFSIKITENMMYMHLKLSVNSYKDYNNSALLARNLIINKEENIRVVLQNKIFDNVENRNLLTLDEVLNEQSNSRFLKDFCFILEEYREPIGYGQILKFSNKYTLVNFGIIPKHRNNGYGYYFLKNIIRECSRANFKDLYLSVNKHNGSAINLYRKIGFEEIYNIMTINFK